MRFDVVTPTAVSASEKMGPRPRWKHVLTSFQPRCAAETKATTPLISHNERNPNEETRMACGAPRRVIPCRPAKAKFQKIDRRKLTDTVNRLPKNFSWHRNSGCQSWYFKSINRYKCCYDATKAITNKATKPKTFLNRQRTSRKSSSSIKGPRNHRTKYSLPWSHLRRDRRRTD